jgi:hypothetical protein
MKDLLTPTVMDARFEDYVGKIWMSTWLAIPQESGLLTFLFKWKYKPEGRAQHSCVVEMEAR